jgi:hypothetical protein
MFGISIFYFLVDNTDFLIPVMALGFIAFLFFSASNGFLIGERNKNKNIKYNFDWINEGDSLNRLERASELIEQRRNGRWLGENVHVDVNETGLESNYVYKYVEENGEDYGVYL